ncbi:MAG TPA: hypothetical protein VFN11_11205 [Ktedonobacterales bacterium]|nr:hypothetical protein [Ktedonobacterales bacterium]
MVSLLRLPSLIDRYDETASEALLAAFISRHGARDVKRRLLPAQTGAMIHQGAPPG